jgi:hypothetical protein
VQRSAVQLSVLRGSVDFVARFRVEVCAVISELCTQALLLLLILLLLLLLLLLLTGWCNGNERLTHNARAI